MLHPFVQIRNDNALRESDSSPSVLPQAQAIPEDAVNEEEDEDEDKTHPPDERVSIRASDKRVQGDNEFSDSEDEGEGGRRDERLVMWQQ